MALDLDLEAVLTIARVGAMTREESAAKHEALAEFDRLDADLAALREKAARPLELRPRERRLRAWAFVALGVFAGTLGAQGWAVNKAVAEGCLDACKEQRAEIYELAHEWSDRLDECREQLSSRESGPMPFSF